MEEKEFIKLIRELQKLQVKVLGKEYLSVDIHLGRANLLLMLVSIYSFMMLKAISKNYIVRLYIVILCVVMK